MPPFKRGLRDELVPLGADDGMDYFVLDALDDGHHGEIGDGEGIFAEDQGGGRVRDAELERIEGARVGIRAGCPGGDECQWEEKEGGEDVGTALKAGRRRVTLMSSWSLLFHLHCAGQQETELRALRSRGSRERKGKASFEVVISYFGILVLHTCNSGIT